MLYELTDENIQAIRNCLYIIESRVIRDPQMITGEDILIKQSVEALQKIVSDYEYQEQLFATD